MSQGLADRVEGGGHREVKKVKESLCLWTPRKNHSEKKKKEGKAGGAKGRCKSRRGKIWQWGKKKKKWN